MNSDKPAYRVGLIGCGRKGHGHARGYVGNPHTELVAAADSDTDNLDIFTQRFGVTGYADYHEMLSSERLDIAAPILPVQPNPQVVVDCAGAGVRAIYCEKPMAVTLAESDEMVEACRSRGIHLAAGDAYRNMPHHWKVKALIDAGELGDVQTINLYQGTGEISGGGCQGLSVLRLFADDADVDWVTGWCSGDPASDHDQGMGGHIRFANGIDASISHKRSALEGIEVVCSKAVYHTNWGSGHLWRGEANGPLAEDESVFEEFGGTAGWMEPSGSRQRGGMESIVDALDHNKEPRCSGDNMRKVLEIAVGLRESHRQGFAPIRFPIEDRSFGIVPNESRLLNKKQVMGEERYAKQIQSAASQPIGGAQVDG
ncbi:MAG: Gfo/Idh/MocA family oxidoreductase [Candidatus Latescibacterota bacterium]|nr:Gfo/Idh/MocA family oxidoreductase [Candidatus Latescibacterota bacterium]